MCVCVCVVCSLPSMPTHVTDVWREQSVTRDIREGFSLAETFNIE